MVIETSSSLNRRSMVPTIDLRLSRLPELSSYVFSMVPPVVISTICRMKMGPVEPREVREVQKKCQHDTNNGGKWLLEYHPRDARV